MLHNQFLLNTLKPDIVPPEWLFDPPEEYAICGLKHIFDNSEEDLDEENHEENSNQDGRGERDEGLWEQGEEIHMLDEEH